MSYDKKSAAKLTLLFTLLYMASYITRTNYGAIISEMVLATGQSKSLLSMALTGSFVTYGAGQIICGILGDRIRPKRMLSIGLALTVAMNIILPFCTSPYLMLAVWSINGFAHSFMWPPMVRMMAALLNPEQYSRATVRVSWGSSFGTIFVYLSAPLIISLLSWRAVFWFSAAMGAIMLVIWHFYGVDVPTQKKELEVKEEQKDKQPLLPLFMVGVMAAIVLQGFLRDGVTTWMPSYIGETYELGSAVSILSGVVLPIFSIFCFSLSATVYRKLLKTPLLCAALFFGIGAASAGLLFLFTGKFAVVSVGASALLTGCMHGVNLMLISMIPAFFKDGGRVSTVSGLLNACTYIGSAASTYGTARLTEEFGWNVTLLLWIAAAVGGTVLCMICALPWKKRFSKQKTE